MSAGNDLCPDLWFSAGEQLSKAGLNLFNGAELTRDAQLAGMRSLIQAGGPTRSQYEWVQRWLEDAAHLISGGSRAALFRKGREGRRHTMGDRGRRICACARRWGHAVLTCRSSIGIHPSFIARPIVTQLRRRLSFRSRTCWRRRQAS